MDVPFTWRPTGWFQIGWADDLPSDGEAVSFRYFGEELAACRGDEAAGEASPNAGLGTHTQRRRRLCRRTSSDPAICVAWRGGRVGLSAQFQ